MSGGYKKYTLPGSNVIAEVDFTIEGNQVIFDGACVGGEYLDCINNYTQRDVITKRGVMTYRSREIIKFRQYFQEKLDEDEEEILEDHAVREAENYHDRRAER